MTSRPHLDLRLVAVVAAGGTLGTAARHAVADVVPVSGGWPFATLLVNVVGSFLLGLLLEALLRRGPETPRGRVVRLGLGTGVLGGLTTFSSLAVELESLVVEGAWSVAAGYAVTSLVLGLLASALGMVLASRPRSVVLAAAPREDPS